MVKGWEWGVGGGRSAGRGAGRQARQCRQNRGLWGEVLRGGGAGTGEVQGEGGTAS